MVSVLNVKHAVAVVLLMQLKCKFCNSYPSILVLCRNSESVMVLISSINDESPPSSPNASIKLALHRQPPKDMPRPAFDNYGSMKVFEDTEKGQVLCTLPTVELGSGSEQQLDGATAPGLEALRAEKGLLCVCDLCRCDAWEAVGRLGCAVPSRDYRCRVLGRSR